MELDFILEIIENNGYLGLFLWLWFGVFGVPIPNEVIAMTVGIAASMEVLNPFVTFAVTYFGILAALTTLYTIGRFLGRPLLPFLQKRKRFAKTIEKSFEFMDKYHSYSLSFSYFIPGVRNFIPFLYGFSKLPYRTFALFAYSGAFVWLTITFSLGYWFGDHQEQIWQYEKELLIGLGILVSLYIGFALIRKKQKEKNKIKVASK
ncbi:DedA family protein [Cytobacillus sp. FJAT-54145]|uniref:DedA family protein n=1 Tax=Cytobacillus spartinae TaxID=3299023 RepID=A0ABW6KHP8_9BACI